MEQTGTGTLRTAPWKAGTKGSWEITKRLSVWMGLFLEIACLLGCPRLQGQDTELRHHLLLLLALSRALPSLFLFPGPEERPRGRPGTGG